ncbi:MAG: VWA domain-containing protein [Actinobacteria bacterium]|nr:VWA domain-containing protein [Actinomycetota bacterium]
MSILNATVLSEDAAQQGMDTLRVSYRGDADSDGVPDLQLLNAKASPLPLDSDGDGLASVVELAAGLRPDLKDTDTDSVFDGNEDTDGDGLTNLVEQTAGLSLTSADTDADGVTDPVERTSGTNPLVVDTDGDGLDDGDELRIATNPLVADSDTDGIVDGDEQVPSVVTGPNRTRALITGRGDLTGSLRIAETTSVAGTATTTGLAGKVYDFDADEADLPRLTNASISLPFSPSVVPASQAQLMHFNELLGLWEPAAATQTVDPVAGLVTASVNRFSDYAVFNVTAWAQALLASASTCTGRGTGGAQDVVFLDLTYVLDSSGSMSSNDPNRLRISAAQQFTDQLLSQDRAAVVDFDDNATVLQQLTSDKAAVKAALNQIDADGGTDIGAGVSAANQMLASNGDPTRSRVMVLLTDGEGSYSDTYTAAAVAAGITIYTVGLGAAPDAALLGRIATGTGGRYYAVADASGIADVFRRISDETAVDTDGDGIGDCDETNGMPTATGKVYRSNPAVADTDRDGLLDGQEIGVYRLGSVLNVFAGVPAPVRDQLAARPEARYFALRSDPRVADTDGDGRNDGLEVAQGTDPLVPDSSIRPKMPPKTGVGQRPAAKLYTAYSPDVLESYALIDVPSLLAPGKGIVRVNGFINRFSDGPLPFINAAGDNRGFDSDAPYWANRVYFEIDHEKGQLLVVVNPSCTVGRNNQIDTCYSALPLSTTGEPGVSLVRGQKNSWFAVDEAPSKLRIRFDLGLSDPPRTANPLIISGFLELRLNSDGTVNFPSNDEMKWRKDPYPSWEIYRQATPSSPPVTVYKWEQTNQGPWSLNEFNWWDTGLCLRYQERRGNPIPEFANWIARPRNGNAAGDVWRWIIPGDDLECAANLWTGWTPL